MATVAVFDAPAGRSAVSDRNRALCAAYLEHLARRERSRLYVYQVAAKLEELVAWCGDREFGDLSTADLEGWCARPNARTGGVRAPASRQKDVVVVRGLCRFAHARGFVLSDAGAELAAVRVRNRNPKAIDLDVWAKVWGSEYLDTTERVVLGLGFFCGLRREEIARLRGDHFDVRAGRIVGFPRKGDQGTGTGVVPYVSCARLFGERLPRAIGVPETFLRPLEAAVGACGGNDGWLVPWGLSAHAQGRRGASGVVSTMTNPDQINRRVQLLLERLGLHGRAFSPHALRHSFVTYMIEPLGVPITTVSQLAGHSDISITMRYVKVASDPLAQYLSNEPLTAARSRW